MSGPPALRKKVSLTGTFSNTNLNWCFGIESDTNKVVGMDFGNDPGFEPTVTT